MATTLSGLPIVVPMNGEIGYRDPPNYNKRDIKKACEVYAERDFPRLFA